MKNILSTIKVPLLIIAILSMVNMLIEIKFPDYRELIRVLYYICLFLCCMNGTYSIKTQYQPSMGACLSVGAIILFVEVMMRAVSIFVIYPNLYSINYGPHWGLISLELLLLYYLPSLPIVLFICYMSAKLYDRRLQTLPPLPEIK